MNTVTRIHHLAEWLDGSSEPPLGEDEKTLIHAVTRSPLICISEDVWDLAQSPQAILSVEALLEAGLGGRLPYPTTIVEMIDSPRQGRTWVYLTEEHAMPVDADIDEGRPDFGARIVTLEKAADRCGEDSVVVDRTIYALWAGRPGNGNVYVGHAGPRLGPPLKYSDLDALAYIKNWLGDVLRTVLLSMATDGFERQRVEPDPALNKARAKRGKPPIPSHTVVRLSHYVDRSGKRHAIGDDTRHVRLHLRAGHIRRQPCGPGGRERKQIYIAPCVVNYRPDAVAPVPIRELRP